MTYRKTKIIATMGPSLASKEKIIAAIDAGVNVFRMNLSHGTHDSHRSLYKLIRQAEFETNSIIAILMDLQGPKIRIACFEQSQVELNTNQEFVIDIHENQLGDAKRVGTSYKKLIKDVKLGTVLLLDDGLIELVVIKINNDSINTKVIIGGYLKDRKGINIKGGGLRASALTAKDEKDLKLAIELKADFVAISFVANPQDVINVQNKLKSKNSSALVVAKIERNEAMENIKEICQISDAIMVARGDLGLEIGVEAVPGAQKKIISLARIYGKPVITATQMLESMTGHPRPTRAEVSDVANAVLDGTDVVMLSGETAAGKYPIEAIGEMHRVCIAAEKMLGDIVLNPVLPLEGIEKNESEAIVISAATTVKTMKNISAIVVLTKSGQTAKLLSKYRLKQPFLGFGHDPSLTRRMALYWGVYPSLFNPENESHIFEVCLRDVEKHGFATSGQQVVVTSGEPFGIVGSTNTLRILTLK